MLHCERRKEVTVSNTHARSNVRACVDDIIETNTIADSMRRRGIFGRHVVPHDVIDRSRILSLGARTEPRCVAWH